MRFFYTLKRVMSINKDYLPFLYITLLLLIVNQGLVAFINYIAGSLTDSITSQNLVLFGRYIIILVVVQLLHMIAGYQVNYRVNYLSESFVNRLRNHTYQKITNASMKWLDENKMGDIISRINGDLNALVEQINTFMTWQLAGIITFLVYMAVCFMINVKLSIISFCIVPVLGIVQFLTGKPIAKLGEKRSVAEGQANSVFVDLISGLAVIKIFRAEKSLSGKYERQIKKTVDANVKSFALEFIMNPLQILLGYLPMIIILLVGSRMVIAGEMTLGMLFSYILLSSSALDSVSSLSWQVRNIYNTIGISERIFEIWDVEEEKNDGTISKKTNEVPITFEHVSFGYNEEKQVLSNINFIVDKCENVAIVGASGSGKSTIMKLLAGFYEKSEGNICVFGNKLEEWDKEALREHMSYVGQESFLFPGSIYSNVALGNNKASKEEVLECIRAVGLDKLDLYTPVGERGVLLSGGQKQRVSVARALLKNADIILLDEPTSALDTESEYYVKQAVDKYTEGKTSITIAHRLTTISNADRILCVKDGKIVESGKHDELMQKDGVYKSLYMKQQTEYA
ncbi:MAG: ABC transporter ATP-binding protein [Coprococcus sp.]